MQQWGNNLRSSGNPYKADFNQNSFIVLSERIDCIIKLIAKINSIHNKNTRICIDAIRNPYEAYYFKDLYKSFYLFLLVQKMICDFGDCHTWMRTNYCPLMIWSILKKNMNLAKFFINKA